MHDDDDDDDDHNMRTAILIIMVSTLPKPISVTAFSYKLLPTFLPFLFFCQEGHGGTVALAVQGELRNAASHAGVWRC